MSKITKFEVDQAQVWIMIKNIVRTWVTMNVNQEGTGIHDSLSHLVQFLSERYPGQHSQRLDECQYVLVVLFNLRSHGCHCSAMGRNRLRELLKQGGFVDRICMQFSQAHTISQ